MRRKFLLTADEIRQEILRSSAKPGSDPRPVATRYRPAADVNIDIFATGNAWKALDVDNLKVSFKVPDSGKVLVTLAGYLRTLAAGQTYWAPCTDHANPGTTVVAASLVRNAIMSGAAATEHVVTGLTPGQTLTYYWAGRTLAVASNQFLQVGAPSQFPYAAMIATPLAP